MAQINIAVTPRNGIPEEDGPHYTADGKVIFCLLTLVGGYDTANRPNLVHALQTDLLKAFGIKYVKAIESFMLGASSVTTGATASTGKYKLRLNADGQTVTVLRVGLDGTPVPVDEAELSNGANITGAAQLIFDCMILGD